MPTTGTISQVIGSTFDAQFPGFGHDTHGVEVKTDESGRPYYALYCLRS